MACSAAGSSAHGGSGADLRTWHAVGWGLLVRAVTAVEQSWYCDGHVSFCTLDQTSVRRVVAKGTWVLAGVVAKEDCP